MLPRLKILIIDDEPQIRALLKRLLGSREYEFSEAADGAAGLAALQGSLPDLIICDLRMPGVDGLTVLATTKREHPELPVIVMSGAGLLEDAVSALKLGAWDYLSKPFPSLDELQATVRRALDGAEIRRQNREYRGHLERANADLQDQLQRVRADEEAGRRVQLRMLPENNVRFDGLELSFSITPSAYLSGDFLDCVRLGERYLCFYFADVAGHGVSSAFVTVVLKSFMQRHLSLELGAPSPAALLEALNRELLRASLGKHVTLFIGVVDLEERSLTFSSAGQSPRPMLYDGRELRLLDTKGLPVGLFSFSTYEDQQVALPERCVLTLCSDGVLPLIAGADTAAKLVELEHAASDLDLTIDQLSRWLGIEDKAPLTDDVALLILHMQGGSHELTGQA